MFKQVVLPFSRLARGAVDGAVDSCFGTFVCVEGVFDDKGA